MALFNAAGRHESLVFFSEDRGNGVTQQRAESAVLAGELLCCRERAISAMRH